MSFEIDESPLDWTCYCCGGPVLPMGALGNRDHGRCRNCGADQSRLNPEDQILRDEEEAGLTAEELEAGQAGFNLTFPPIVTRPGQSLIDTVQEARYNDEDESFNNDMKPRP